MKRIATLLAGAVLVLLAVAYLESLPDSVSTWPDPFPRTFLTIYVWQWFLLVAMVGVCFVAGLWVRLVANRFTYVRDKILSQPMSDTARLGISRAASLLAATALALALLPALRLDQATLTSSGLHVTTFGTHVEVLVGALCAAAATMFVYSLWDATCDTLAAKAAGHMRAERLLVPMMRKFIRAVIVVCGVLIGLAILFGTKTLTGLVAGVGVTGLVVALAAKDSVENVFGSLTILFDMPFALGDYVRIDKVEGNVEEINLRSTRIRTAEDTLITLPNANLIRASVENFGARRSRRQKLTLRLSYLSERAGVEALRDDIRQFINQMGNVETVRTLVHLDDPTETSLGLVVIWYLDTHSVLEEAQSRSRVLDEALRLKRNRGVLLASVPPLPEQKG